MLEPDMMHIVFVHYLDVKVNKTNIAAASTDTDEVTSDSQKGSSVSSGFPRNYSSVPSGSTDSMSPTSTLTSLCEDADSGYSDDIHQASSGLHSFRESQNMGNGQPMNKIDTHSNSSYLMHPFSGDHGQLSISGTDYIHLVQGDKSRPSDTTYIEGQRAHGMASWDNVMEQSAGLHTDPSPVSSTSITSSSIRNILEQEHAALTEEAGSSQALQSNWQIPFEDNTVPKWSFTQSLSIEFGSDYSTGLLGNETNNASSEIGSDLFAFNYEPKEQSVQQDFSKQHTLTQSQRALKSEHEVPGEESINYALTVKGGLLDGKESLKKVDSFSRY